MALEPASPSEQAPHVPLDTTLRNAVSLMLETKSEQLVVEDDDGRVKGVFHLSDAGALL